MWRTWIVDHSYILWWGIQGAGLAIIIKQINYFQRKREKMFVKLQKQTKDRLWSVFLLTWCRDCCLCHWSPAQWAQQPQTTEAQRRPNFTAAHNNMYSQSSVRQLQHSASFSALLSVIWRQKGVRCHATICPHHCCWQVWWLQPGVGWDQLKINKSTVC